MSNQLNQNNQKKHTRPSSTPDEYSNLSIGSKGFYPVPELPDITHRIHYKQLAFNFYEKTFLNNFENHSAGELYSSVHETFKTKASTVALLEEAQMYRENITTELFKITNITPQAFVLTSGAKATNVNVPVAKRDEHIKYICITSKINPHKIHETLELEDKSFQFFLPLPQTIVPTVSASPPPVNTPNTSSAKTPAYTDLPEKTRDALDEKTFDGLAETARMLFSPTPKNPPQPAPVNNDGISALSSARTSNDMETYGGNLDFMNSQEAFDTLFPSKQPLTLSTTPGQDFPIEELDTKFKDAVEK